MGAAPREGNPARGDRRPSSDVAARRGCEPWYGMADPVPAAPGLARRIVRALTALLGLATAAPAPLAQAQGGGSPAGPLREWPIDRLREWPIARFGDWAVFGHERPPSWRYCIVTLRPEAPEARGIRLDLHPSFQRGGGWYLSLRLPEPAQLERPSPGAALTFAWWPAEPGRPPARFTLPVHEELDPTNRQRSLGSWLRIYPEAESLLDAAAAAGRLDLTLPDGRKHAVPSRGFVPLREAMRTGLAGVPGCEAMMRPRPGE